MGFVEEEGVVEEGGELLGLPRHGLGGGLLALLGVPQGFRGLLHLRGVGGLEDGQALEERGRAVRLAGRRGAGEDGFEGVEAPVLLAERLSGPSRRARRSCLRASRGGPCGPGPRPSAPCRAWCGPAGGWPARPRGRRGRGPSRGRRRASTGPRRAWSRARCRRGRGGRRRAGCPSRAPPCPCAACRGPAPRWWRRRGRGRPATRGRRCRCPSPPPGRTRRRSRPWGGGGSSSRPSRPCCGSPSGRSRR